MSTVRPTALVWSSGRAARSDSAATRSSRSVFALLQDETMMKQGRHATSRHGEEHVRCAARFGLALRGEFGGCATTPADDPEV